MNPRNLVLLVLIALVSSGCTGLADGAADVGATVTYTWTAYDTVTGDIVDGPATRSQDVIGDDRSMWGVHGDRRLIGHGSGDSFSFVAEPLRVMSSEVNRFDAVDSAGVSDYERAIGKPPVVGDTFTLGGYQNVVRSIQGGQVEYGVLINGTQRDDASIVGATLLSNIVGNEVVLTLEPVVGANFTIQADFSGNTLLGMDAGNYQSVGSKDGYIIYRYSATGPVPTAGTMLRFVIDVTLVTPAPLFEGDGYGSRRSPVLLGDVNELAIGHDHDGHGADGHGADGHTH